MGEREPPGGSPPDLNRSLRAVAFDSELGGAVVTDQFTKDSEGGVAKGDDHLGAGNPEFSEKPIPMIAQPLGDDLGLPDSVYGDPKFSFRVFLVPKTGNHASTSDRAFEFVKFDPSRPDDMAQLHRQIAVVKERQVAVVDPDLMSAKDVVKVVAERLKRPFKMHHHVKAWKKYGARKAGDFPAECNPSFCVPDTRHRDYAFRRAWVDHLIMKLSDQAEYEALTATKSTATTGAPSPGKPGNQPPT